MKAEEIRALAEKAHLAAVEAVPVEDSDAEVDAIAKAIGGAVAAEREANISALKGIKLEMEGEDTAFSRGFMEGSEQSRRACIATLRARGEQDDG